VKLAERAEPELYRSNQILWLNRLEDEFDNLRTALDWALATDVESGLRIASIPWRFWDARSHLQELGGWLSQFLDQYNSIDRLHALAMGVYASLLFRKSDFTKSTTYARHGLQMARTLSDQQLEAFSLSLLGVITQLLGNVGEGIPLLEQGLALHRAVGDKIGQANTLEWLSYDHTNLERAIAFAKESLSIHRELNNLIGIANVLVILARLTLWSGDFSSAAPWLEEALSISRQLGDQATELGVMISFGLLSHWQGNYPKAIAHYQEAILLSEKIGDRYQNLWTHVRMAHTYLRKGDTQQALSLFKASLEDKQMASFTIALVYAIEGLASLNVKDGEPERAARLFAWSDTMRERIGDRRPPVEQASVESDLEIIRSQISDSDFRNASEYGRAMGIEQAMALALEENPK
jgi:tetratricopeptide (TPR) repeat protein